MEEVNEEKAIETFLLRINKEVKALAEVEAKKMERSLNWYIGDLIKTDLKQKGIL
jgi:predicted HicB family RNase H-like nuclease